MAGCSLGTDNSKTQLTENLLQEDTISLSISNEETITNKHKIHISPEQFDAQMNYITKNGTEIKDVLTFKAYTFNDEDGGLHQMYVDKKSGQIDVFYYKDGTENHQDNNFVAYTIHNDYILPQIFYRDTEKHRQNQLTIQWSQKSFFRHIEKR